jgi:hypothetical protein
MTANHSNLQYYQVKKDIYVYFKGYLFLFDFENDLIKVCDRLPDNAKQLQCLPKVTPKENTKWALDCLTSAQPSFSWIGEDDVAFGKPCKNPINDEGLFPKSTLTIATTKRKDPCNYFNDYEKDTKKKKRL